jgi:hypothetical protein
VPGPAMQDVFAEFFNGRTVAVMEIFLSSADCFNRKGTQRTQKIYFSA